MIGIPRTEKWLFWLSRLGALVVPSAFGIVLFLLLNAPSRWDGAIVIRVCPGGVLILRLADGLVVARQDGFSTWRVEGDPEKVCR